MAIWDREDETEWEKYQRSRGRRGRPSPPPPAEEPQGEREPVLERLLGRLRPEKPEEPPGPPERCPWCGGEMERGFLWGGMLYWSRKKPGLLPGRDTEKIRLGGPETAYQTAWRCAACQKLTMDIPGPGEVSEAVKKTMWPPPEDGGAGEDQQ